MSLDKGCLDPARAHVSILSGYDVAPDRRFLINTVLDEAPAPITLLQNWNPEARK
jgi:hypothetical protein